MTVLRTLAFGLLLGGGTLLASVTPGYGATFTVNTILDPGVAGCDFVECSLREAIEASNLSAGADTISFNIAGSGTQTITLLSLLPDITDSVTIDGTTQPGFAGTPLIEIDGGSAGAGIDGLRITGGGSAVLSLAINDFGGDGIEMLTNGGNLIKGSRIGTSPNGLTDVPNDVSGISINGSAGNTIGGPTLADRNIISGTNTAGSIAGVLITGAGATANHVLGNYIGVDANGGQSLTNGTGVEISGGASGNTIGGTSAGARNVISDNNTGVEISGSATSGNMIQGNYIGPDATGTVEFFSQNYGVFVDGAASNTIGGSASGAGNLISGNQSDGIWLYGSSGPVTGIVIQGNVIGPNAAGTGNLGNSTGIEVGGPVGMVTGTVIGGASSGARNVISANGSSGIWVTATSNNTTIQGNLLGTTVSGTAALPNSNGGIVVNGTNATIGGAAAGAGNVISGNSESGVVIAGAGATGAVIQGNYIGTNITGAADLGNARSGVRINGSPGVIIGGSAGGARNVISGNNRDGIEINATSATGTVVRGNYIGLNAAGTSAVANTQQGVNSNGASGTVLGGSSPGEGNVISGNGANGILIGGTAETNCAGGFDDDFDGLLNDGCPQVGPSSETGPQCTNSADDDGDFSINDGCPVASGGDTIAGNRIGTDATGSPGLGNSQNGISISLVPGVTVGGVTAGAGNTIASNGGDGVRVTGFTANMIRANSIYSNTGMGIENISGGNGELSPPVITSNSSAAGTACSLCTVDVFSDSADEGRIYHGSTTADAGGNWSYPGVVAGPNLTATGTDTAGSTSEFSTPVTCIDGDTDSVCDGGDNCLGTPNTAQGNSVHPATAAGDACEDPDADLIFDLTDNCPDTANPGQENVVHPSTLLGDTCDDPDLDGVFDATDNCPNAANDQADFDSDGLGDACDSDDDDDGVGDADEAQCGGNALDGGIRPERVDDIFAGIDDDGDSSIDEPLPAGTSAFDCDGDGFRGSTEDWVYEGAGGRDQDACGNDGWPADLAFGGVSANRVTLVDLSSYIAPAPKKLNTSPGGEGYDVRWDLIPGSNTPTKINVADMSVLVVGASSRPPMFGGVRMFGGPVCPWGP